MEQSSGMSSTDVGRNFQLTYDHITLVSKRLADETPNF
jgi:hypothetical protein